MLALGACAAEPERTEPAPATPAPIDVAGGRSIGRSVEGRPIEAVTVGRGGARLLLIGAIHGDELEGVESAEVMREAMAGSPVTLRIIRDMNPDGAAAGTRANARGVDLNRNWPASNFRRGGGRGPHPLSEPETWAVSVEIDAFAPDVVVVFHSTARGPFVNFDGPGADLAAAFANGAARTDARWRVVPDMGYPTPGSLGTHVGIDRGVPILTIEFDRGQSAASARAAAAAGTHALIDEMTSGSDADDPR